MGLDFTISDAKLYLALHSLKEISMKNTRKSLPIEPESSTDFPAYSDTGYSDTPLTVTVLTVPNWSFIYKKDVVRVTPLLQ